MGNLQDDENLRFEEWKSHYRELLTSGQYSLEHLLLDLTHEFMVPLTRILAWTEHMRDYMPVGEITDSVLQGEVLTGRDVLDMILREVTRQQEMFNYVRFEVWRDEQTPSSDSGES